MTSRPQTSMGAPLQQATTPKAFTGHANSSGLSPTASPPNGSLRSQLRKSLTHSGRSVHSEEVPVNAEVPAYEYVHLHEKLPYALVPTTPKELLTREAERQRDDAVKRAASPSPMRSVSRSKLAEEERHEHHLKSAMAKKKSAHPTNDAFQTRVSFDTVNLQFSDDVVHAASPNGRKGRRNSSSSSLLDKEFGFTQDSATSDDWRPSRNRSLSPTSRDLSPRSRLPSERSKSPPRKGSPTRKKAIDNFRKYPTTPIITHDSCTYTKKHRLFDDLYSGRLRPRTAHLPNRNIVCYVSGRRHTWVAIDWCCNQLLEDGDTLIIIASIRPNWARSLQRRLSPGRALSVSPEAVTEESIRRSPEYTKAVTANLMKYALAVINSDKIIKIVVELGVGPTKDVLKDMYSLYVPSLVCTATKPTAAPSTKAWQTSRITDRMVKNFPIPVIVIPSLNMSMFQSKLFRTLDKRMRLAAENGYVLEGGDNEAEHEINDELDTAGFFSLDDQLVSLKKSAPDNKTASDDLAEMVHIYPQFSGLLKSEFNIEDSDYDDDDDDGDEDDDDDDEVTRRKAVATSEGEATMPEEGNPEPTEKSEATSPPQSPKRRSATAPVVILSPVDGASDADDDHSINSDEGVSDTDDDDDDRVSYQTRDTAPFNVKHREWETRLDIYRNLAELESDPTPADERFKDKLGLISDAAYDYGVYLAELAKGGGQDAALVRTLTGAPDVSVYRPKSMIPASISDASSISSKKSSKSASSSTGNRSKSKPMIQLDSAYKNVSGKPRAQSLRFSVSPQLSPSESKGSLHSGTSIRSAKSLSYASPSIHSSAPKTKERKKSFFKKLFS